MPCFTQNYLAISSAICQCSAKNGKPYQFRQQPLSRYHSWNGTRLVFPEDKVRERGEGVYLFCVYSFFSWKGGPWQINLIWNLPVAVPLLTLLILFKLKYCTKLDDTQFWMAMYLKSPSPSKSNIFQVSKLESFMQIFIRWNKKVTGRSHVHLALKHPKVQKVFLKKGAKCQNIFLHQFSSQHLVTYFLNFLIELNIHINKGVPTKEVFQDEGKQFSR